MEKMYKVWARSYPEFSESYTGESPSKAKSKYYWKHCDGMDMLGLGYIDLRARRTF